MALPEHEPDMNAVSCAMLGRRLKASKLDTLQRQSQTMSSLVIIVNDEAQIVYCSV
jgi:hypothetical protein